MWALVILIIGIIVVGGIMIDLSEKAELKKIMATWGKDLSADEIELIKKHRESLAYDIRKAEKALNEAQNKITPR